MNYIKINKTWKKISVKLHLEHGAGSNERTIYSVKEDYIQMGCFYGSYEERTDYLEKISNCRAGKFWGLDEAQNILGLRVFKQVLLNSLYLTHDLDLLTNCIVYLLEKGLSFDKKDEELLLSYYNRQDLKSILVKVLKKVKGRDAKSRVLSFTKDISNSLYLQLFENDPGLKSFRELFTFGSYTLTGGAVVDIIEGRTPKDYDFNFYGSLEDLLQICELSDGKISFLYTSPFSTTLESEDGFIFQFLNKDSDDFTFFNEKNRVSIDEGKVTVEKLNTFLIGEKVLIADSNNISINKISPSGFMERVSKWESKGYYFHPTSYRSFLQKLVKELEDSKLLKGGEYGESS